MITYRAPAFRAVIPQGQHFHLEFTPYVDVVDLEPYQFLTNGCTARVDVKTSDGIPVVSFATSGEAGLITLDDFGNVALDLDHEATNALKPTTEFAGALHQPLFGDLVITHDATPWLMVKGTFEITRKVTDA